MPLWECPRAEYPTDRLAAQRAQSVYQIPLRRPVYYRFVEAQVVFILALLAGAGIALFHFSDVPILRLLGAIPGVFFGGMVLYGIVSWLVNLRAAHPADCGLYILPDALLLIDPRAVCYYIPAARLKDVRIDSIGVYVDDFHDKDENRNRNQSSNANESVSPEGDAYRQNLFLECVLDADNTPDNKCKFINVFLPVYPAIGLVEARSMILNVCPPRAK